MSSNSLSTIKGSICIVVAHFLFATNAVIIKSSKLTETQILFGRFSTQFIFAIIWWIVWKIKQNENILNRNWYGNENDITKLWIRGFLYICCIFCYYYAISCNLPVGDATLIFFVLSPYEIAFIAHIFLKEKLPKLRVIIPCIVLFIIGTILLAQPTFIFALLLKQKSYEPLDTIGVVMVILSTLFWAISNVLIRNAKDSHFLQLELTTSSQTTIIWIPLLIILNNFVIGDNIIGKGHDFGWEFSLYAVVIMIVVGLIGFASLTFTVIAYQYGNATQIVWLEYVEPVFVFLYQIFVFKDIPNAYGIIGVICLFIGCIIRLTDQMYDFWLQQKLEKEQNQLVLVELNEYVSMDA
eukprot:288057_1